MTVPKALTIAGSDSGGCAGIQADLKTFAALGVHGMSVITSATAQDTLHVHASYDLPLENIERQLDAVINDIGVDVVKTGMLASSEIIGLVAAKMQSYEIERLIVDPVMVTTGGDPLIRPDAIDALKVKLLSLALVVTPNLREAEMLVGYKIAGKTDLEQAMDDILRLGCAAVIVKGGHFENPDQSVDYFFDGEEVFSFAAPRIETKNTHGSGCTFASALAAYLAHGLDLRRAVAEGKEYVTEAIRHSFPLGRGHGPLGHFWRWWEDPPLP